MPRTLTWEEDTSARTRASLENYYRQHVLREDHFLCPFAQPCKTSVPGMDFYEGQLSHVGRRYELKVENRPLRILVIAMSYGSGPAQVSMDARSAMIAADGRHEFHLVPSGARTKHMQGTLLVLNELVGVPAAVPPGSEHVDHRSPAGHLYDHFAFVNALLCSAITKDGSPKDKSSRAMRYNCKANLHAALEILRPTIVVVQGRDPEAALGGVLTRDCETLGRIRVGSVDAVACLLSHPSSPSNGWSTRNFAQWQNVVQPTLAEARRRAGI